MRTPIIAGNWKLNKTPSEATALAREVRRKTASIRGVEVVIAPTFVCLAPVAATLEGSNVRLSAQNVFWEDQGAFTGEISAPMLRDVGCQHVIIGHSERRQYFGETDETVAQRVRAALDHGLLPIICIGERLEQREAGQTLDVIKRQLDGALATSKDDEISRLVIAYEPIWAIGTGRTASPEQAHEVHAFIRQRLIDRYDATTADAVRIQYGGSVKPGNAAELLSQADIDGALVGGASLDPDSFAAIVRAAVA